MSVSEKNNYFNQFFLGHMCTSSVAEFQGAYLALLYKY